MIALILYLTEVLTFQLLEEDPAHMLHIDGGAYERTDQFEAMPVFYDWLVDSAGQLCSLEVHVSGELLFGESTRSRPYFQQHAFPRIRLCDTTIAHELGLEAFGDIAFFRSKSGIDAVVVGLDLWLNETQYCGLIENLTKQFKLT